MTDHKQLRVILILPIDPPRPFTGSADNSPTLATKVRWERIVSEERDLNWAVVFTEGDMYRSYFPFDEIPDWVPRPPASWDAIVSELAAEVLA